MNAARCAKYLIAVAGAVLVAAGAVRVAPPASAAGAGQEGAPQAAPEQDPEEFHLTERERVGTEGARMRVGDTQLIFDSVMDFADTANDLFVWSWRPAISGTITDNAVVGGQRLDIRPQARIGGDLFMLGQNADIHGQIGGDFYGFVAALDIGELAVIEGAMYGSAAELTISGDVGGPVNMVGGVIIINGIVRDDVRLEAGELVLGPDARIEGELRYESAREADIDPAQVGGGIRYFVPRAEDEDEAPESWISFWSILWDTWWLLSSFLVGAIALALGGDAARKPATELTRQPALGLGFGFVIAVVFPAAAILSMILLVTIPLGLIGMAVYFAAAYLARLVAAQALGQGLLTRMMGREVSAYGSLGVGLILFYILTHIPHVGFLIWLAAVVAGLGGMFLATRDDDPDDLAAITGSPVPGV